jgi:N-methylhydantoinase A/oxoprolinase/acetone carboxylase beta subunit
MDLKAAAEGLGLEVSMQFLPGGLHSRPRELRQRLQAAIDEASRDRRGDLIAIGYGVCGLGTVGLRSRAVPLAIPRVNDCIAQFLGSDAAYRGEFANYPGTYYISAGWVEEKGHPQDGGARKEQRDPDRPDFEQLLARHGRENAEAIRYFLNSWQRNYQRAAFIDTGVAGRRKYADIARTMAAEFGWKYEELAGTGELLRKLLTPRASAEVLLVPPHHLVTYDAARKGLSCAPVWEGKDVTATAAQLEGIDEGNGASAGADTGRSVRMGLGIDAGGTYTDVVVYDFAADQVRQKAKALTTPWDYLLGMNEALDALDERHLRQVDLVSISTTLATNAIVEGRGQKAGLLIMPPYGLFEEEDISFRPLAVLSGRLEIDGTVIAPVDRQQVVRAAKEMVQREGVRALAVAGFASGANPAQELEVKRIVEEATGLVVTCGHEVSDMVNYRIRAETAALNARLIPILEKLLDDATASLGRRGIEAPVMVVKSDGSLMGVQAARQCPIQTILSGPAASVAGASYLAKLPDAIVVDVGGTTTDTAVIRNSSVRTCEEGASVGHWRTHVRALDMRTLGLGGDSLLVRQGGEVRIGPRRVSPLCWLASRECGTAEALKWLEGRIDRFAVSTAEMELLALTSGGTSEGLGKAEADVLELLRERPMSLNELLCRTGCLATSFLPLARLEERHLIHRCGLTPTDLLHVTGQMALWDAQAASRATDLFARSGNVSREDFARDVLRQFVHRLAVEIFKKELDDETDGDGLDDSPAAGALVRNLLAGGSEAYHVQVRLRRPIIGIGAPVHLFLPAAAELLQTRAVIPPNADVANAIGAITSSVYIRRTVEIVPTEAGSYRVHGVEHAPVFQDFEEAHRYAAGELQRLVRVSARAAGTSQQAVEITVNDRIGTLADGGSLFVGRTLLARLVGRPDLPRLG